VAKKREVSVDIVVDSSQAQTALQKFTASLEKAGGAGETSSVKVGQIGKAVNSAADETAAGGGRFANLWQSLRRNVGSSIDDMAKDHKILGGAMKDLGITGESVMAKALPAAAAGGAAAVGVFVAKAITGFSQLVTQTDKLSTVSNLSAQDASRWIEVAGDWGVSADQLTTTFGKLGKAIGANPVVLREYGIELAKTKTGQVDMGATMNNVLDAIGQQADATRKDEMAQKLLGRSYAELAPLIAQTRTEREKALAGVNASKVVTEAEIKANRQWKQSLDSIGDAASDTKNAVGKVLLPEVEKYTHAVSTAAKGVSSGVDWLMKFSGANDEAADKAEQLSTSVAGLAETHRENARAVHDSSIETERATAEQALADEQVKDLKRSVETYAKAEQDARRSIQDRTRATQEAMGSGRDWNRGQLDLIQAEKDVAQAMRDSEQQQGRNREANLKAALAGEELRGKIADLGKAFADMKGVAQTSTEYIPTQIAGLNELKAQFPELAKIIDEYIAKLAAIPRTITTEVSVDPSGGRGAPGYGNGPFQRIGAGGGPSQFASFGGPAGGGGVTIIVNALMDGPEVGQRVLESLAAANRSAGATIPARLIGS
jgi:hypothetical protein